MRLQQVKGPYLASSFTGNLLLVGTINENSFLPTLHIVNDVLQLYKLCYSSHNTQRDKNSTFQMGKHELNCITMMTRAFIFKLCHQ